MEPDRDTRPASELDGSPSPGRSGSDEPRARPGWKAWAEGLGVFVLFVLLSILMTWPLARNLDRAVSDPGDPLLNAWIMEWTWHSLTTEPRGFWHAPVFHPLRYTIAFSENLLGITIPLLPLFAAGLKPLVIYNVAILLGFAWSGFGAFVLGRLVTGSRSAGIVGGIFFAFMPYRFDQLAHLQHVWSGWIPFVLAALFWYGRAPGWKRAMLLGVALVFNGMSNGHWLLFGAVAICLGAAMLALASSRMLDQGFWVPLLVVLGVAHGGMFLVLQPYQKAAELYEMKRGVGEAATFSAEPSDWLAAGRYNRLYGGTSRWDRAERSLFPGALVLLLGAMGVLLLRREDLPAIGASATGAGARTEATPKLRRVLLALDVTALASFLTMASGFADRGGDQTATWKASALPAVVLLIVSFVRLWIAYPRAWGGPEKSLGRYVGASRWNPELWVAALWVAVGFFGSLGMNSFLHQFLFSTLSPFRSLRVPARWAMIGYVGLAVLAAVGAVALLARLSGRRRVAAFAAISALLLLELRAAPIRWLFFDAATPAVYEWLASAPFDGAVLETPIDDWSEYTYMFRSMAHRRPILNGVSGYPTRSHLAIKASLERDPIPGELINRLERDGCGILVVHNDDFSTPESMRTWLRARIESGRLRFVRRFDHGAGGDYVFALTGVETGIEALRPEPLPDLAGRTPDENARLFLDENARTYNGITFGWLDKPRFNDEIKGPLVVSGWALSPVGVREVKVSFENDGVAMVADRFPWPRLSELFPWYPGNDRPGFSLSVPDRPDDVSLLTDVLVEIVDGNGNVRALDHLFLEWHPAKPIPLEGLDLARLADLAAEVGVEPAGLETILGGDPSPLADALLARVEASSDSEFLDAVFTALLERMPEGEGRDYYLTRLGRGGTRRDVVEAILGSEEFRSRLARRELRSP